MALNKGTLFRFSSFSFVLILATTMSTLFPASIAAPSPVPVNEHIELVGSPSAEIMQHRRPFVTKDQSNLIPGIVSTNDFMLEDAVGGGDSSSDKNAESVLVLHRVKRGRIKVRYNRNKDVVRDY